MALALVVVSAQVGVIGAVSVLAAPGAFRALGTEAAGPYLRYLFPRYFAASAILALAAAISALLVGAAGLALVLLADGACFAGALALVPQINAARDRGEARFARLHGYSVGANGAGLVLALAAIVWLALG
jgi:hypothetical protein